MTHENILRYINLICQRYFSTMSADKMTNRIILEIILANVHDNEGNHLDFEKLMKLDDHSFCHDIVGLYCHTDVIKNFNLNHQYLPKCGFKKEKKENEASIKMECISDYTKNKQLFEIKVIQLQGEKECLDGFIKNLRNEIPKHGFYPCLEKKIIKE